MKTLTLLCGLLTLVACNGAKQPSADGYTFARKEWPASSITVTIVEHRSLAELQRTGPKIGQGRELQAWSRISTDHRTCEVHIIDPAVSYRPEWIGHEITHCAYGRWH